MISGATTFALSAWIATPRSTTAKALRASPEPSTKSAGSRVERRVPKNGTIAMSPVKMPNASQ